MGTILLTRGLYVCPLTEREEDGREETSSEGFSEDDPEDILDNYRLHSQNPV